MCVGESLEEREAGKHEEVVVEQLKNGLSGLAADDQLRCTIAYEPVWAIGTGKTATPEDAQEMCAAVRSTVHGKWGGEAADGVRVQYGGSVKPVNAPDLMGQADIDGALVGGASLDPDEFARIVAYRLVG